MIYIFYLLVLTTTTLSLEETKINITNTETLDDYILCRICGSDISSSNYIISMKSPVSRYAFNDTLFSKEVLIQVLSNDIFIDFPVITVIHSNCVSTGKWEEHESWFPGYRWKICICPDCGEYIGWLFEPINPVKVSIKPFFGLILHTLIGESFIESLTKYPAIESLN